MTIDVFKVTDSPKSKESLITMTQGLESRRSAQQIIDFVTRFDVAKVKSYEDIAKGYKGIFMICLHLGSHDAGVRRQCEVLIKCMQGITQAYEKHLSLEFPQKLKEQINNEVARLLEMLEPMLSKEEYQRIKQNLESL